jgi:hypothetical protein
MIWNSIILGASYSHCYISSSYISSSTQRLSSSGYSEQLQLCDSYTLLLCASKVCTWKRSTSASIVHLRYECTNKMYVYTMCAGPRQDQWMQEFEQGWNSNNSNMQQQPNFAHVSTVCFVIVYYTIQSALRSSVHMCR